MTNPIIELGARTEAHHRLKFNLRDVHPPERCNVPECELCGIILCPYDCPEHLWKDGCPCCYGTAVEPIPWGG